MTLFVSSEVSNSAATDKILQFLHERSFQTQKHVDGDEILVAIKITEQELKNSLQILEDDGFVGIIRPSGYLPKAKITASGRKHIQHKSEEPPSQLRILLTAANPQNDLKVTDELEFIQDELLMRTEQRNRFKTAIYQSLKKSDFVGLLIEFKPYIVHFSGHGEPDGTLLVIGSDGNKINIVGPNDLAEIFSIVKSQFKVHCIVMNACYSENNAKELIKHVDYVIGVSGQVEDSVAIEFATEFYRGLGHGYSVDDAFSLAKIAMTDITTGLDLPFVLKKR